MGFYTLLVCVLPPTYYRTAQKSKPIHLTIFPFSFYFIYVTTFDYLSVNFVSYITKFYSKGVYICYD